MAIVRPTIVAPDTSHWSRWIDDALSNDEEKRGPALNVHQRLLDEGRVPILSWHHIEELLCVKSAKNASARISYIMSLPLIAWIKSSSDMGLGSVVDILAAEVIAVTEGCQKLTDVRDRARSIVIKTGPAINALGDENWIWDVVRPHVVSGMPTLGMNSMLSDFEILDENLTIGELARGTLASPQNRSEAWKSLRSQIVQELLVADSKRTSEEAEGLAEKFMAKMREMAPGDVASVRELIVMLFVGGGFDPNEVRDECTIAELFELGEFRQKMRIVSDKTGIAFEQLKHFDMTILPSWRINNAIQKFGQKRRRRPGSDATDRFLATLVAYVDVLYVDKRTHEDLRRVAQKDRELAGLFGEISKANSIV